MLDGLAVLIHVTQCGGDMIVGLSQQATVGRQVLQLQGKTLLEVFKCLGIVTWGNKRGNSYLCGTFVTGVNWNKKKKLLNTRANTRTGIKPDSALTSPSFRYV